MLVVGCWLVVGGCELFFVVVTVVVVAAAVAAVAVAVADAVAAAVAVANYCGCWLLVVGWCCLVVGGWLFDVVRVCVWFGEFVGMGVYLWLLACRLSFSGRCGVFVSCVSFCVCVCVVPFCVHDGVLEVVCACVCVCARDFAVVLFFGCCTLCVVCCGCVVRTCCWTCVCLCLRACACI